MFSFFQESKDEQQRLLYYNEQAREYNRQIMEQNIQTIEKYEKAREYNRQIMEQNIQTIEKYEKAAENHKKFVKILINAALVLIIVFVVCIYSIGDYLIFEKLQKCFMY